MNNLPMTPFGTVRHRAVEDTTMNYDNEADDLMNHEVTDEDLRPDEEELKKWEELAEEAEELPTPEEAELGELSKTPEGVECRFCGLPLEDLRENHEEKCPEGLSPTCWDSVDAEQLKMEAEAMGFIVYEGGDF